jgi:hypothetical protein
LVEGSTNRITKKKSFKFTFGVVFGVRAGVLGSGGFSAAPTLVEAQREALTDRLRREFGLFLSDDEELERQRQRSQSAAAAAGIIPPAPTSVVSHPQPSQGKTSLSLPPSFLPYLCKLSRFFFFFVCLCV